MKAQIVIYDESVLSFRLTPFTPEPPLSSVSVHGALERKGRRVRATFHLSGDLDALLLPEPAAVPARRDELWQDTCFELFAGWPGEDGYSEINVAPSGDWNAYGFSGYREGMRPLAAAVERQPVPGAVFALSFVAELPPPTGTKDDALVMEVAVSAVLAHEGGRRSYWALCHRGEQPDFHRRDSFVLRL